MTVVELEKSIAGKYSVMKPELTERSRRVWAATEARALGYGGIRLVHRATGVDTKTIMTGLYEIDNSNVRTPLGRIRRGGGGRKTLKERDETLVGDLESLVEPDERGDPEVSIRWTTKSIVALAEALHGLAHAISPMTVLRILSELGYSLQTNKKTREGTNHPDRNLQFHYINTSIAEQQKKNQPCISVDTKKKELVGNYKNNGKEWRPKGKPREVHGHDFPDKKLGKAAPYGIYDLIKNEGWVNVGVSADTAQFAVESIRRWWKYMGKKRYPQAAELLITADSGGSNSARSRLWKVELQKLATELNLTIKVRHFPPGTSKWNKIEHRLFSMISKNWRGKPLNSLATIINLIGSTTTATGLIVKATLDNNVYQKGIKVSDKTFNALAIIRDAFHGDWNYTIEPVCGVP
jgi:transposase